MNLQHGKLLKLEKYNDYFVRFQIVLFRILGLINICTEIKLPIHQFSKRLLLSRQVSSLP
jgi:hypothetical protein